jgi:hypothetical protein
MEGIGLIVAAGPAIALALVGAFVAWVLMRHIH